MNYGYWYGSRIDVNDHGNVRHDMPHIIEYYEYQMNAWLVGIERPWFAR